MKAKVIMTASSKGGVGKSTAALGIAAALARRGRRVLLCDLDFGNACLDLLLGVQDSVIYTVADAARGICAAGDAVISDAGGSEICFLPCPAGGVLRPEEGSEVTPEALMRAVAEAAESTEAEYVVLDTGAGINPVSDAAAETAGIVLIVSGHTPLALRAAQSCAQRFSSSGSQDVRLLINSFDFAAVLKKKRRGLLDIIDSSGARLAGVIPYDYTLMLRGEGENVKACLSDAAFDNTAARLDGDSPPLFEGMKKMRKQRKKLYK